EVPARLRRPRAVLEERSSDTAIEIRARAVVDRIPARGTSEVREHPRRRGLAIRAGDARDAVFELRGERTDEVRVHGEGDETRKRGGAAAGRAETLSGQLAGGICDKREGVRHE